jgi:hypothetical protein
MPIPPAEKGSKQSGWSRKPLAWLLSLGVDSNDRIDRLQGGL